MKACINAAINKDLKSLMLKHILGSNGVPPDQHLKRIAYGGVWGGAMVGVHCR